MGFDFERPLVRILPSSQTPLRKIINILRARFKMAHTISSTLVAFALFATVYGQSDLKSALEKSGVRAVYPNNGEYSSASVSFNKRYSYQPAVITYPTSAEQVSAVIKAGGENNYNVIARSGGHSYIAAGLGGKDGEVVVDMSGMASITYDDSTSLATIGVGARLGSVANKLNQHGRAIPHGNCPYVGVGGHQAAGGFGITSRMWGLLMDSIEEHTVVIANGTIITASSSENPDLYWGLLGAGSSFGITTSVVVKTYPVPSYSTSWNYDWMMDPSTAAQAFVDYQNWILDGIPRELGVEGWFSRGDSLGQIHVQFHGMWNGPRGDALDNALRPLLSKLPAPRFNNLEGDGTFIDALRLRSGGSLDTSRPDNPSAFYAKSLMTPESEVISPNVSLNWMNYLANEGFTTGTGWFFQAEAYGGPNSQINARPVDSTAFASRSTLLTIQLYSYSANGQPPYPEEGYTFVDGAAAAIVDSMPSDWAYGTYLNYPDDRLDNWQHLYYGQHYERLSELKDLYDPSRVFAFPLGVE